MLDSGWDGVVDCGADGLGAGGWNPAAAWPGESSASAGVGMDYMTGSGGWLRSSSVIEAEDPFFGYQMDGLLWRMPGYWYTSLMIKRSNGSWCHVLKAPHWIGRSGP